MGMNTYLNFDVLECDARVVASCDIVIMHGLQAILPSLLKLSDLLRGDRVLFLFGHVSPSSRNLFQQSARRQLFARSGFAVQLDERCPKINNRSQFDSYVTYLRCASSLPGSQTPATH